jgi:hypothetical protein
LDLRKIAKEAANVIYKREQAVGFLFRKKKTFFKKSIFVF